MKKVIFTALLFCLALTLAASEVKAAETGGKELKEALQ
jgi:hypothetical protein